VPPTSKRMVWRVANNGGSLRDGAEAFVLFLCGAQLVLRASVLTVLDLDEVIVLLKNDENLRRCCLGKVDLPMVGGAAELPPATPKNPSSSIASLFLFPAEMGATGTAPRRLEVHLFLSEKRGGKSHFGVFLVSVVLGI